MPSVRSADRANETDDVVIDVVVPVYNNFTDAQRLFTSLSVASNKTVCRLVIIDDASSESAKLRLPAPSDQISDVCFIRNETNLGFAATVNKAMRLGRGDVVLLNTDTLVFDGWLDRLGAVSRSRPGVGTVTPLSNAATILSYPTFPVEFKSELEIGWPSLDALCAKGAAAPVVVPTGIGFCMLVTRACIDAVGYFDDVAFKRGYGEECDFCRRAASAGWINLAAPNVFVWHRGEGSFAGRARALRDSAQLTLRRRHPDYPSLVATFVANDPLAKVRRSLDLARITVDPRPGRLHLRIGAPNRPGDLQKEMFFEREGRVTRRYRPVISNFGALPNLQAFTFTTTISVIRTFLIEAQITEVVLYSRMSGFVFRRFARAARYLGLRISHSRMRN